MDRTTGPGFKVDDAIDGGRVLTVTGPWTQDAAATLQAGGIDYLYLNHTAGFSEPDLDFLEAWPGVRRLHVLDHRLRDIRGIHTLGGSLEKLDLGRVDPRAKIDLGLLPHLKTLSGSWRQLGPTLDRLHHLERMWVADFTGPDLTALSSHGELESLSLVGARSLQSVAGAGSLQHLSHLKIALAPRLSSVSHLRPLADSLTELWIQTCRSFTALEDIGALGSLRFLAVADCGEFPSLTPLRPLVHLETLYAWGTTKIADADLQPLLELPRLREVRLRSRKTYHPSVQEITSALEARTQQSAI